MLGNGVAIMARRALPQITFWWKKILHQNWYVCRLWKLCPTSFPQFHIISFIITFDAFNEEVAY